MIYSSVTHIIVPVSTSPDSTANFRFRRTDNASRVVIDPNYASIFPPEDGRCKFAAWCSRGPTETWKTHGVNAQITYATQRIRSKGEVTHLAIPRCQNVDCEIEHASENPNTQIVVKMADAIHASAPKTETVTLTLGGVTTNYYVSEKAAELQTRMQSGMFLVEPGYFLQNASLMSQNTALRAELDAMIVSDFVGTISYIRIYKDVPLCIQCETRSANAIEFKCSHVARCSECSSSSAIRCPSCDATRRSAPIFFVHSETRSPETGFDSENE